MTSETGEVIGVATNARGARREIRRIRVGGAGGGVRAATLGGVFAQPAEVRPVGVSDDELLADFGAANPHAIVEPLPG